VIQNLLVLVPFCHGFRSPSSPDLSAEILDKKKGTEITVPSLPMTPDHFTRISGRRKAAAPAAWSCVQLLRIPRLRS
jgi:hypothetical protein